MTFKPFPLVDPKAKTTFNSAQSIKPRAYMPKDFPTGTTMWRKNSGAKPMPHLHIACEPGKFERRQLKPSQVKAAHVKFLDDEGWGRAQIAAFLEVKASFVASVLSLYSHRYVAAAKPPTYVKSEGSQ